MCTQKLVLPARQFPESFAGGGATLTVRTRDLSSSTFPWTCAIPTSVQEVEPVQDRNKRQEEAVELQVDLLECLLLLCGEGHPFDDRWYSSIVEQLVIALAVVDGCVLWCHVE